MFHEDQPKMFWAAWAVLAGTVGYQVITGAASLVATIHSSLAAVVR